MLLTQHYYVANGQDATSTMDFFVGATSDARDRSADARDGRIARGDRQRLSHCRVQFLLQRRRARISDGFGTALWAIDLLFTNAEHGSSGVPGNVNLSVYAIAAGGKSIVLSNSRHREVIFLIASATVPTARERYRC